MSDTTDWIKHWLPELDEIFNEFETDTVTDMDAKLAYLKSEVATYIRTHQLDLVDQFRDHIEGAYEAVEMAMGEAYYQITQADKKDGK